MGSSKNMMKDNVQENELQTIITMSSAPIEDLKSVINNIREHIQLYQEIPSIAKPFIKRDIPTITNLKEDEWLEFLNGIKENLESINSAASKIIGKNQLTVERPARIKRTRSKKSDSLFDFSSFIHKEKIKQKSQESRETTPTRQQASATKEEKKPDEEVVYCPECGQKCKGKKGLKVHVHQSHNDQKKELLKAIKQYNI
jgi:hypothetical protein